MPVWFVWGNGYVESAMKFESIDAAENYFRDQLNELWDENAHAWIYADDPRDERDPYPDYCLTIDANETIQRVHC